MTVLQKKADNPIAHLTAEDIEQLGVELDAIRADRHRRRAASATRRTSARSSPPSASSSSAAAPCCSSRCSRRPGSSARPASSVAKILENMEIGHNVMHGQWDWMRDPKIHSTTWEWDNASPVRAVEALAQRAAPHLHERDRQGQRPRLRHHARRRGPALGARSTSRSRCGTSSTPASSSTASRRTTSSSARTCHARSAAPARSSRPAPRQTLTKIRQQMTKDYVVHPLLSGPSVPATRWPPTPPPTWSATCGPTR